MDKYIEEIVKVINWRTTFLIILAFLSGSVNYFYRLSKWENWELKKYLINNTFAMLVWYSASILMPDWEFEKVVVIASAFIARDLLALMEIYLVKFAEKKIKQELNITDQDLNINEIKKW